MFREREGPAPSCIKSTYQFGRWKSRGGEGSKQPTGHDQEAENTESSPLLPVAFVVVVALTPYIFKLSAITWN